MEMVAPLISKHWKFRQAHPKTIGMHTPESANFGTPTCVRQKRAHKMMGVTTGVFPSEKLSRPI